MKVAVYGSRRQQGSDLEYITRFLVDLRKNDIEIVMHGKVYRHLCQCARQAADTASEVIDNNDFTADIAVSLGGDGTFLRTAAWVGDKNIPIVGVNTGHLGYLTALHIQELPDLLSMLKDDRLRVERRMLLHVKSEELPEHAWPYALNEVVVSKQDSASMIECQVMMDGSTLGSYRADGLLIATPTGSTAYNLSVGGPIVEPTVEVLVLSPIAAHSLSMRPMVVDGNARITVGTSSRAEHVRITLDGRSYVVPTGTELCLSKASFRTLILQRSDGSFADALREKLHWGEY